MTLGENIRELRKKKRLTIEGLANELNSNYSTIGMYELDKRKPDYPMLLKLATYFNVTVDYLLGVKKSSIPDASDLYREFIEQKVPIDKLAGNIGISIDTLYKILKSEDGATESDYLKFAKWLGYSDDKSKQFYYKNAPSAKMPIELIKNTDFIHIPIFSSIYSTQVLSNNETIDGYFPTDKQFIDNNYEYFYLKINDDSMDKEFKKGSLVLVQVQNNIKSNEIGVVFTKDNDVIVRKVFIKDKFINLIPDSNNNVHQPQFFDIEEVQIVGKVVLAVKKY